MRRLNTAPSRFQSRYGASVSRARSRWFPRLAGLSGSLFLLAVLAAAVTGCSDLFGPSYRYASATVETVDSTGAPVSGVALTLFTGNRHLGYGETGLDGVHQFQFLVEGWYGIALSVPDGWRVPDGDSNVTFIQMKEGETITVRRVLVPETGTTGERAPG